MRTVQIVHVCAHGARAAANFFVYYEIDEDESKHALSLDEYGHQEVTNAWVLLEAAEE